MRLLVEGKLVASSTVVGRRRRRQRHWFPVFCPVAVGELFEHRDQVEQLMMMVKPFGVRPTSDCIGACIRHLPRISRDCVGTTSLAQERNRNCVRFLWSDLGQV